MSLGSELAEIGRELGTWGVTGLTDATPDLDGPALDAIRASLPQRVWSLGPGRTHLPRKVVVADHDRNTWDRVHAGVAAARAAGRPVALHAVTRTGLALALAVLEEFGVVRGDRIEHAAVCDDRAADRMAELGLVVVTQPSIAARRGAAMVEEVEPEDRPWLWRLRGLVERGVDVVLSSDAPYGDANPWTSVRLAAVGASGRGSPWVSDQTIEARAALGCYLTAPGDPAGPERSVEVDAPADLCLLDSPLEEALARVVDGRTDAPVRATFIGGVRVGQ
nr:amidohydrolase family protein [Nocardioides sp. IC4_145]